MTIGKANEGKNRYEMTHRKNPNLKKLRIFGCAAYVHEVNESRNWKLVKRGKPGILLGNQGGMYRLWKMDNRMIIVSKHVLFDEIIFPCKKNQPRYTEEDDE